MPPMVPTVPSGVMVPAPATNFPPLSSPGASLSMMPRLSMVPALSAAHAAELDPSNSGNGALYVVPTPIPRNARDGSSGAVPAGDGDVLRAAARGRAHPDHDVVARFHRRHLLGDRLGTVTRRPSIASSTSPGASFPSLWGCW